MQPTLVLSAPQPGILYLNGRFAGEISNDIPLMRPVSSRGALYLDYRPLTAGCEGFARKLVFSDGLPMLESVESAPNLNVVIWPGGIVEIEFNPEIPVPDRHFTLSGRAFHLENNRLFCEGQPLAMLPRGAKQPQMRSYAGGSLLTGDCEGGRYLLFTDAACASQLGFLQAQQIELTDDGIVSAIVSPGDLAGHAALERWRITPDGLSLLSRESIWLHGAPRWPQTPAETARAAMEAEMLGLRDEAEGYLTPALRAKNILAALCRDCDLCVEMKYAPPDSLPAIGMLHLQGERLARVEPLRYAAVPSAGVQGPWQIDGFE